MQLPFCKICGEYHRLGHCPLWDEPPIIESKPDAEKDQSPAGAAEEESPGIVAQAQGREIWNYQARVLAPEDMKQEIMPDIRPRFDRNAYQRELMRRRYWAKRSVRCAE